MEVLMSRYILEVLKDPSLFKKYGNGWYPSIDEYHKFIHKQEKNNENFSKLLNRYKLVKKSDKVIETVMSKDIDSISTFLNNESVKILSGYGTIKINSDIVIPKLEYFSCYISNGVYYDSIDLINIMLNHGSFVIGVCDNPKSDFYKENIEKLKEISNYLHKKHISYNTYQHVNHRDNCYVLSYRSDKL